MTIKRSDIFLVVAALIITSILMIWPRLVSLEQVKERVIAETNQMLAGRTDFASLKWRWFPVPHLILKDIRIDSPDFSAKIPEMHLSPSLRSLLTLSIKLSSVTINQPEIHLKKIPQKNDSESTISSIMVDSIRISNGKVISENDMTLNGYHIVPIELSNIKARLEISPTGLNLRQLRFSSSFCRDANINGSFNLPRDMLSAKLSFTELDISKIMPDILAKSGYSISSKLNISCDIGRKGDFTTTQIWSGASELNIGYKGKQYPFQLELAQAELKQSADGFYLNLQKTDLSLPGLAMSGAIQMIDASTEPYWHINLSATDVDAGQVRGHVRGLLDFSEEAIRTTDIVLGGSLPKAGFEFHGKTSDFRLLQKMTITADVKDAPIQLIEPKLFIDSASGQIIIQNGILWAEGFYGNVGLSKGKNCTIFVPIDCIEDTFLLDVDIDADLSELPAILNDVVPIQWFKDELKLISHTSGRASAHLHVGDDLKQLGAWVDVSNAELKARYARIPWDIDVNGLALNVTPESVSWTNLKGATGPHTIRKSAGNVRWNNEDDHLDPILSLSDTEFSGDINELLKHLISYQQILEPVTKVVSSASGSFEADKLTLTGPFFKPGEWQYDVSASFKNIFFDSPLLFGKAAIKSAKATVTHETMIFSEVEATVSEEPFLINADISHKHLAPQAGKLTLNGVAGEDALAWVRQKGWLPHLFFPKKNCGMKNLALAWDQDGFTLNGALFPGASYDMEELAVTYDVAVELDIQLIQQKLDINSINIISGQEQGRISCSFNSADLNKGFDITFKGKLSGAALDLALEHNDILTGTIFGDFSLAYNPEAKQPFTGKGRLEATSLKWLWGTPMPIYIAQIKLQDANEQMTEKTPEGTQKISIEELNVNIGSSFLYGNGLFYSSDEASGYKLKLSTAHLSSKDIDAFMEAQDENSFTSRMTKEIRFDVGEYLHFPESKPCSNPECKEEKPLFFQSVFGTFVAKQGKKTFTLESARLCGLNVKGKWSTKGKAPMYGVMTLGSESPEGSSQPLQLETLLSCMNMAQETIEGPGIIQAKLEGSPSFWSKGSLTVNSDQGRINRLTFLSKVFSVVNLTDIFTGLLPNLTEAGFAYSNLELKGDVKDNVLTVARTVIKGEGLNLIITGSVNLDSMAGELLVLIAPLKTVDAIVTKIPLLGRLLAGKSGAVLVIPVAVKGKLSDPDVTVLPASAIGSGIANLIKDTLTLPFEVVLTPFK